MERYCFYCGKKLMPGERCDCRYAQKRHESSDYRNQAADAFEQAAQNADSTATAAATQARTSDRRQERHSERTQRRQQRAERRSQRQAESRQAAEEAKRARADRKAGRQQKSAYGYHGSRTGRSLNEAVLRLTYTIRQFCREPSQAIIDATRLSIRWLVGLNLIQLLLYFSIVRRLIDRTNLGNWLIFAAMRPDNKLNFTNLMLMVLLFSALLITFNLVVRALSYKLTISFSKYRANQPFSAHLKAMMPSTFYYNLFLIAANVAAFGSGLTSLMLIGAGTAVRFVVDYRAQRHISGLDDNNFFWRAALATIIQAVALALLTQILLPNVFNFNFFALKQ